MHPLAFSGRSVIPGLVTRTSPFFLCFVYCLILLPHSPFASTARLAGTIFTIDANQIQTIWPNARVTLKNLSTGKELSTVSDDLGGELNDYNQFFGNFPYPLIRPNQYGPLSSDAPNRVRFRGIIGLPYRLQFVPILDAHSGFPYSKLDANWSYIGQRNEAGRFPAFASLDLKLQYPFNFKFRGHRIQFLGGLKVIDVTNHYNPRDVQQYLGSPNYGVFYNSVGRLWRIDGDFDF